MQSIIGVPSLTRLLSEKKRQPTNFTQHKLNDLGMRGDMAESGQSYADFNHRI